MSGYAIIEMIVNNHGGVRFQDMEFTESSILTGVSRQQILCFTGHRPEKLPKGKQYEVLLQTLYYYIDIAINQGYTVFLDGMADGIDYAAAEYLFRKRQDYPRLRIVGVQPFENYEAFFRHRGYSLAHLKHMQESFDGIICLKGKYDASAENDLPFRARNYFLVDHSSALIAVCSLTRSGAKQTFDYARKKKLSICRIEAKPCLLYTPTPEQWPVEKINF